MAVVVSGELVASGSTWTNATFLTCAAADDDETNVIEGYDQAKEVQGNEQLISKITMRKMTISIAERLRSNSVSPLQMTSKMLLSTNWNKKRMRRTHHTVFTHRDKNVTPNIRRIQEFTQVDNNLVICKKVHIFISCCKTTFVSIAPSGIAWMIPKVPIRSYLVSTSQAEQSPQGWWS